MTRTEQTAAYSRLGLSISFLSFPSLPPPPLLPSLTTFSFSLPEFNPGHRAVAIVNPRDLHLSLEPSLPVANMGRTVDQEVHAAFVEFRAKEDDKVRDCVFRNISAHIILSTKTKHAAVTDIPYVVSLRPVYLLPADPRKEHLATEAASPRMPRPARPPQRAAAVSARPGRP